MVDIHGGALPLYVGFQDLGLKQSSMIWPSFPLEVLDHFLLKMIRMVLKGNDIKTTKEIMELLGR